MQNCVAEAGVEVFDTNQNPNQKNNCGKNTTTSQLLLTAFNVEKTPKIDNASVTTRLLLRAMQGCCKAFKSHAIFMQL